MQTLPHITKWIRASVILFLAAFATPSAVGASTIAVTFDTTALSGTSAELAFDLIDGSDPLDTAHSVTISDFSTDGVLGSVLTTGGVSGILPGSVTLSDTAFFNEYLTGITLGSKISFLLTTTGGDPLSFGPDTLSVFLLAFSSPLDPFSLPIVDTTDGSGADSLMTLNLNSGIASPFATIGIPLVGVTATPVPEPASLVLVAVGLVGFGARRFRRARQ